MKHPLWITLFIIGLTVGCGGTEKKSSNSTSAANPPQKAPVAEQQASFKSSTPRDAVASFLDALRAGDKTTTEAMLTEKARSETKAHDLVVEPPGAPTATYTIGEVQHAEGDDASAYVSCVWAESNDNSEFEVVWILRSEDSGWRIAGMATQLPESDQPVILNFEDLSELEETMQKTEVAQQADPGGTSQGTNTPLR